MKLDLIIFHNPVLSLMHASYVIRNTSTGIVRDTKRFHMPQHFQICISMTILFSPNSTYKTGYSVLVFEGKWTVSGCFAMLREKWDELKYDAYFVPDSHAFHATHAQAAPCH